MIPNLDDLYAVLRQWALEGGPRSYTDLSHAYHARTGDWFEPHGSWDKPLGELKNRLAAVGAPALSALVILQEANEPGGKFWGCAPNVPRRPANDIDRLTEWNRIVRCALTRGQRCSRCSFVNCRCADAQSGGRWIRLFDQQSCRIIGFNLHSGDNKFYGLKLWISFEG